MPRGIDDNFVPPFPANRLKEPRLLFVLSAFKPRLDFAKRRKRSAVFRRPKDGILILNGSRKPAQAFDLPRIRPNEKLDVVRRARLGSAKLPFNGRHSDKLGRLRFRARTKAAFRIRLFRGNRGRRAGARLRIRGPFGASFADERPEPRRGIVPKFRIERFYVG